MQITDHTDLLNALIKKYNLGSYLEIGVQNPENNFDKVKPIGSLKIGVDPEVKQQTREGSRICYIMQQSSDDFFDNQFNKRKPGPLIFDLIFIDGLHHADQVKRDFENSLRCLSDNGFIVIHDVLPENEEGTKVPRETKVWWGDVYKWAMNMAQYYTISWVTYAIDNGCMVVRKTPKGKMFYTHGATVNFDWDGYLSEGRKLMNVTDTCTFENI